MTTTDPDESNQSLRFLPRPLCIPCHAFPDFASHDVKAIYVRITGCGVACSSLWYPQRNQKSQRATLSDSTSTAATTITTTPHTQTDRHIDLASSHSEKGRWCARWTRCQRKQRCRHHLFISQALPTVILSSRHHWCRLFLMRLTPTLCRIHYSFAFMVWSDPRVKGRQVEVKNWFIHLRPLQILRLNTCAVVLCYSSFSYFFISILKTSTQGVRHRRLMNRRETQFLNTLIFGQILELFRVKI